MLCSSPWGKPLTCIIILILHDIKRQLSLISSLSELRLSEKLSNLLKAAQVVWHEARTQTHVCLTLKSLPASIKLVLRMTSYRWELEVWTVNPKLTRSHQDVQRGTQPPGRGCPYEFRKGELGSESSELEEHPVSQRCLISDTCVN